MPAAVLALSYFYLAFQYSSLNLWGRVVHENGKYTLFETIFYADHFVREVLICVLSGSVIAFSFLLAAPAVPAPAVPRLRRAAGLSSLGAAVFLGAAVLAAVRKIGPVSVAQDFLQFRMREGEMSFGSHWKGHFLHLLFIFIFSMSLSFLYRGAVRCDTAGAGRRTLLFILGWAGLFLFFEFFFRGAGEALSEPRYLAHQFREIATHAVITVPLCFAALSQIENRFLGGKTVDKLIEKPLIRKAFLCFLIASLIPIFILLRLKGIDVLSLAQKKSTFIDLFASHAFEHTLDYFFTPLVAVTGYVFISSRSLLASSSGDVLRPSQNSRAGCLRGKTHFWWK